MKKMAGICAVSVAAVFWLVFAGVAAAAPLVLFDQSHDQRFEIAKEGPLQLSGLATVIREEGFDVRSSTEPLSDEALNGVAVLVISGPFKPLAVAEVEAVARFVQRGGRLVAMLHIASPFADLLQRLEVNFTNYVLYEQENIIDGDSLNFQVKVMQLSPLFAEIDHFSLYGGWALMNSSPAVKIIASTSPRGWVDLNGDKSLSKGDVVGSFGVVVAGELGAGRYIIFGDDAIFQNKFLDKQNRQLAINLARWFK